MDLLLDQRRMTGAAVHDTPTDVRRAWELFAINPNFVGFRRDGELGLRTLVETDVHVPAYVNHSRWVADCPECAGGIAAWPDHELGACLDCGRIYRIDFPTSDAVAAAEPVLLARPEIHRHWRPEDETPLDLKVDNVVRGFPIKRSPLIREVASVHGIDEPHARRLLDAIAETGNRLLLPRDVA